MIPWLSMSIIQKSPLRGSRLSSADCITIQQWQLTYRLQKVLSTCANQLTSDKCNSSKTKCKMTLCSTFLLYALCVSLSCLAENYLIQNIYAFHFQNNSILDGLKLWKRNVDKRFEGVDSCTLHPTVLHISQWLIIIK